MYNLKLYPLEKTAFIFKQFLYAYFSNVYLDFVYIIRFYFGIKKSG